MGNNCCCEADFSKIDKMGAVDIKGEEDQVKNSKEKLKTEQKVESRNNSKKILSPGIKKEAGGTGGTDGPITSAKDLSNGTGGN